MAGLWQGLSETLARLEAMAADPDERLDRSALDVLPGLQYALHRASELAVGIAPPRGAETAHAELAAALADARDATADVIDCLEAGGADAAALLVHEWRGALFRVRLARHRLAERPGQTSAGLEERRDLSKGALAATFLVLTGTIAFTAGATLALWPLWAAGLMLVASGFVAYRP